MYVFFNNTAATEIYTLSLHDALPISVVGAGAVVNGTIPPRSLVVGNPGKATPIKGALAWHQATARSEEHTSELQSRQYLVCRLLLEKKQSSNFNVTTRAYLSPVQMLP